MNPIVTRPLINIMATPHFIMGSEPPAARYPLADDVAHIYVHTKFKLKKTRVEEGSQEIAEQKVWQIIFGKLVSGFGGRE